MREKTIILRNKETIELLEEAKLKVLKNNGSTTTYDDVINKALKVFLK